MADLADAIRGISKWGLRLAVLVAERPFTTDAWKFIEFAKFDVADPSDRGRVNALSNAKRSVANRVDTLLYSYGLTYHARKERWNYPTKAEKLRQIGVPVHEALQELITSSRNDLEHRYMIPERHKDVRTSVQVADLFLRATDPWVEKGNFRWAVTAPENVTDCADKKVSDIPDSAMGILTDRVKWTLAVYDEGTVHSAQFLDYSAAQVGELFRLLYASIQPRKTSVVGPIDEQSFAQSYL